IEAPAGVWQPSCPGRLRSVSGFEGAAAAELGAAACGSSVDRRGRLDARTPGPLRVPAAACRWRLSWADFLYAGNKGAVLAGAARFGGHPGGGCARRDRL